MTSFQTIKQLEEKTVANEISLMVWSDRMDLVAFSNVKGEVALHRLSWTRAWNLSPPEENLEVKAIAWRPDGKILAVGYVTGEVLMISAEYKKSLNVKNANSEITCITWVQEKGETRDKDNFTLQDEGKMDYMKYIDLSKLYLKDPISSSTLDSPSSTEEAEEKYFLLEQTEFNLLLIGTKNGFIHIRIFGCFTCCILNVNEYLGRSCSVEGIHVSEDISKIFVTVKDSDLNIKIVLINANILKTHTRELFSIAMKYVKLIDIVTYLTNTITNITETWESFLLEIDHKLSKYAKKVPEGGVTADFLDLLIFGICSPELQEFLMTDLTKKGLEKFGQTVEMSYANIQRLLLKNVSKFGQNLSYHLAELRGMARLEDRYEVLGLSEHQITEAIQSSGAFLLKSGEMQQIINHSVVNYKAFFRWLYGAILFLMDETIPSEIHKMAQQDLAYITEFLQNFDNIGNKDGNNKKGFVMERLGQYLADAPLTLAPNMEGNDWTTFLNENECVGNHPSIFKYYANTSLIQQFKDLAIKITSIFESPKGILPNQFKHVHTFDCFNFKQNMLHITSVNVNKEMVLFGILEPFCHLHLLQVHVTEDRCLARCGKFYFTDLTEESDQIYQILDLSFYSTNIISLLIQDIHGYKTATLLQLPLPPALEKLTEIDINVALSRAVLSITNGSTFVPKLFKNIDMTASSFAVSGSRRVGIVLSENKRKVKLFEMEAEDEDEEDADMTNSVLKEDVSMQDSHIID